MCKKILIVMFLNIVIALTMTSCSVEKKGDAPVETPVSSVSAVERTLTGSATVTLQKQLGSFSATKSANRSCISCHSNCTSTNN